MSSVFVHDVVWIHQLVGETFHLQSKHGCIGICRSGVCPLMKLASAWLKVMPLQCVLTFSGDLLLEVHKVIVYQL